MWFWRTLLLVLLVAGSGQADEPSWEERQNIPTWAAASLANDAFSLKYALSTHLNPYLIQGDFNGDGRIDLAVLVEARATGAKGVAIVHAGAHQPFVLGADNPIGAGGSNFAWMNAWQVYPKGTVQQGATPDPPPSLRGDALLVEKLAAASGIIYWDGSSYEWYQQGD